MSCWARGDAAGVKRWRPGRALNRPASTAASPGCVLCTPMAVIRASSRRRPHAGSGSPRPRRLLRPGYRVPCAAGVAGRQAHLHLALPPPPPRQAGGAPHSRQHRSTRPLPRFFEIGRQVRGDPELFLLEGGRGPKVTDIRRSHQLPAQKTNADLVLVALVRQISDTKSETQSQISCCNA